MGKKSSNKPRKTLKELQNEFNQLNDDIEKFNKDKEKVIDGEHGENEVKKFENSFREIMDDLKNNIKGEVTAKEIKDLFPLEKISNMCIQLGNPVTLGAAKKTYDKLTDQNVNTEIANTENADKKIVEARLRQIEYYDYNKSADDKYNLSFGHRDKMFYTLSSIIHDDKLVQHLELDQAKKINERLLGYENHSRAGLMSVLERKKSPETKATPTPHKEESSAKTPVSEEKHQEKRTPIIRGNNVHTKSLPPVQMNFEEKMLKLKEDVNTQKESFFEAKEEYNADSLLVKMRTLLNLISFITQINPDKETNAHDYAQTMLSRDEAADMFGKILDKAPAEEHHSAEDKLELIAKQMTSEIGRAIDNYNQLMKDDIFLKVVENKKELLQEMHPTEPSKK